MDRVSKPDFWNKLYREKSTHWDIGAPTPILTDFLKNRPNLGNVCVLGSGNGHDALEFAQYGHTVYAVDFAEEPILNLKSLSQRKKIDINLINEDIFKLGSMYNNFFDLVFEYTCYCAINPNRRKEYFELNHRILKKGSRLFGIFLPLDREISNEGPPFGVSISEIESLINGKFKIVVNKFSDLSISPRANREKLIILEKI